MSYLSPLLVARGPRPARTLAQAGAVRRATEHLDLLPGISRSGLIDQLVFVGYSTEEAMDAVDTISPDWDKQALGCAEEYLDRGFSSSGLIDHLKYQGFTKTQIEHAVNRVGLATTT